MGRAQNRRNRPSDIRGQTEREEAVEVHEVNQGAVLEQRGYTVKDTTALEAAVAGAKNPTLEGQKASDEAAGEVAVDAEGHLEEEKSESGEEEDDSGKTGDEFAGLEGDEKADAEKYEEIPVNRPDSAQPMRKAAGEKRATAAEIDRLNQQREAQLAKHRAEMKAAEDEANQVIAYLRSGR